MRIAKRPNFRTYRKISIITIFQVICPDYPEIFRDDYLCENFIQKIPKSDIAILFGHKLCVTQNREKL